MARVVDDPSEDLARGTERGAESQTRRSGRRGPKTFPLVARDDADERVTLNAMADCGITSVALVPPKRLDARNAAGIGAIVFDERPLVVLPSEVRQDAVKVRYVSPVTAEAERFPRVCWLAPGQAEAEMVE